MEYSRFNIVSKIEDSEEYFIINSLYGSADIIDKSAYSDLLEGRCPDNSFYSRGYLVDPEQEKIVFREAYLRFIDERETDEIQLFFVPGYNCNFNCGYCYQGDYRAPSSRNFNGIADAFFEYIEEEFQGRRKYITLFGGEPLLPGNTNMNHIDYLVTGSSKRNIDIAVVTNGYHIAEYLDILKKAGIREIQVTLDGTEEIHNKRRSLKNGGGTFGRIVKGVDLLIRNDIAVNLRVVVDRDNIAGLPALADFAIDRGWTGYERFSTQLGRNYELHGCRSNSSRLFSRIELYRELYRLIRKHPRILDFHSPAFSVSRALMDNGELPPPLFDSCPGTKTEWAFDFSGKIYACTATVGKEGEELGSFYPERELYREKVDEWSERDIFSIKECLNCNLNLLCGGGCAALANNRNGCINSPDCRPVQELLALGISLYFPELITGKK